MYDSNNVSIERLPKVYSDLLTISINLHNYKRVGSDIAPQNIYIIINFIEEMFDDHLYLWCQINTQNNDRYKGYSECIRAFAKMHNIELDGDDEDISFDGLKRRELRYRKSKSGINNVAGLFHKKAEKSKKIEKTLPYCVPSIIQHHSFHFFHFFDSYSIFSVNKTPNA